MALPVACFKHFADQETGERPVHLHITDCQSPMKQPTHMYISSMNGYIKLTEGENWRAFPREAVNSDAATMPIKAARKDTKRER